MYFVSAQPMSQERSLAFLGTKLEITFAASKYYRHHHTFPVIEMDLATVQDWTKSRRDQLTASDYLAAIDALAMLLDGSESPSATAATITRAYSHYVEQPLKNSDSDRVQRFWGIFCDAARTFGSAQSRLIGLLHEISMQPDMKTTDGSLAKAPNGRIYWRDLPGLPFALCDDALRSFLLLRHRPASANDGSRLQSSV
jgi:hypothetical protein